MSPREDNLSEFYLSTQRSVLQCPNPRKRSQLIEQAQAEECLKFDNQKCQQRFYSSLRESNVHFIATSRDPKQVLHASVQFPSGQSTQRSTKSCFSHSNNLFNSQVIEQPATPPEMLTARALAPNRNSDVSARRAKEPEPVEKSRLKFDLPL